MNETADSTDSAEIASGESVVATLNRLLRLDYESMQAYGAAIAALRDERHRLTLVGFRRDHQRHIMELVDLIRGAGGEPLDPREIPAGAFQWGIRAVAGLGGDREVLSAFRANEEQVRDEYRRVARASLPVAAADLVRRNAEDEERHLAWVEALLESSVRMAS